MGLLDAAFTDPTTIGLLSAASGLLQAGGPSPIPVSNGQAIGRMINSGLLGYSSALDHQIKRDELQQIAEYRKAQAEQLKQKVSSAKEMEDFFKSRLYGAPGLLSAPNMATVPRPAEQGAKLGDVGPIETNTVRMNAINPIQPPMPNSAFPFSLNDITYLKSRGIDLTDIYKLATDPIKLEGGNTYRDRATGAERYMPKLGEGMIHGPLGGVSLAPGYLDSMGAIKGAETNAAEGAKANYDLLPLGYVGQDGRPLGGTRGTYISNFNPPIPPKPPQGSVPGRNGLDLSRLTPQQRAFLLQQDPEAFSNGLARFAGNTPPLQSEAERTQQIGTITGQLTTQTDLNKNWITASYNPVLDAGRAAGSLTASLDALKNINLQTGWGTEAKANAANVLTGLGIAPKSAATFATNAQRFQSVAMDRLLTVLQAQKGPQTEGDSTRAQQTFVQLRNTPAANQFISDFARAKANMDVRRAQFYQEALPLAQQTGDLNEVDRRWAKIQGSVWDDPVLARWGKK